MKQFYIYVHCRPNGEPFYVGKGSGRRAYNLNRKHNPHHNNVVAKYGKENILIYIRNCESEQQAFEHERWMKSWCDAQGYNLTNMTDGGEGAAGYRATPAERAAQSEKSRSYWKDPKRRKAHIEFMRSQWTSERRLSHSKKIKDLWTNAHKSKVSPNLKAAWTPKLRAAMSIRMLGNKFAMGHSHLHTIETRSAIASRMLGNKHTKGYFWINNNESEKLINGDIPNGWAKGRLCKRT